MAQDKNQSFEYIIAQQVRDMQAKGKGYNEYDLIASIAPLFILVNPPLSILVTVCAEVVSGYQKHSNLKEQKMPDTWLKKVSESDEVSEEGVQYLAKKLSKNGHVSVADALAFLELEKNIKEQLHAEQQKQKALNNQGAVSLLEKANQQCPGLYSGAIDSFKKSWTAISDVGDTAMALSNKGINAVRGLLKR